MEEIETEAGPVDECVDVAFQTGMAHFYRGEMQRMTVWRTRLDTTTHWAIILTTGLTTFTLGSTSVPHFTMLLALAFNTIFMFIEGRRYQHLHHSKWRLSMLEHNHFGPMLRQPQALMEPTWRQQLCMDLQRPHFTISLLMGVRLRLRRNYLVLVYFITAVWLTKLYIHPQSPVDLVAYYTRLAVGDLFPSWFVVLTACAFVISVSGLVLLTPSEEALEHWSKQAHADFVRSQDR
jgi:uncharacterized membrane protein